MNHLIFEDLGIIDYEIALQIQQKYFDENIYNILNGLETIDRVLFCQHPAVYTIGKNGDKQNLLITPSDAKLFQTNRGGDITFHGLGQWVVYPILNLEKRNMEMFASLVGDEIVRNGLLELIKESTNFDSL